MGRKHLGAFVLVVAAVALALWAGFGTAKAQPKAAKLDKVTLQLKWVTQSQFAGYYAAKSKGYYKAFGLDVNLKVGGPSITPEAVVASGQAQIGVDWLPSLLATRDTGTKLVNIAQMFARSGMTELTWKDSGITSIAKMRNKTVGVWCCGNQFELYAALTKHGMDPEKNKGVKIFNQPFTMTRFLQPAHRRRGSDDVQRARAGPRVEEPEDRQAVHAQGPERLPAAERGHLDARGRPVRARENWVSSQSRRRDAVHRRVRPRLDLLPRPRAGVHEHRRQERHRAPGAGTSSGR